MFVRGSNNFAALLNQEIADVERQQRTEEDDAATCREFSVQRLVAAQATIAPNAVAVCAGDETLTYRELDARANQLAQRLRALGVGRNVVVGLCLARSTAMVVGALGILKAGGAYLALDPSYPPTRLGFQLADAAATVLVTGQCVSARLPRGAWQILELSPGGQLITAETDFVPVQLPDIDRQEATDLAYVIYTSGSTGHPKGVEITHAALHNLVSWHREAFAVSAADRATQQASPGFDAAVWEVWPYLTAGASLHLPNDDTRSNPEEFRNWLVEHAITIAFVPTPMAERLMTLEWPPETALRVLLTGADTLRHYPPPTLPFTLVNNYGPTECTVVSTSGTIVPNEAMQLPSIGRPISNVQVYILDENMRPLPSDVPGELYVGGVGLARGYRNRPDLTAERFVPNPFSQEPGARLYRTGDRACYLQDGQIAFLGRIDDQLKIRGYRIEPEEIVATIDRYPSVQASLVTAREDVRGVKELVAYVVPQEGAALTAKLLRDFLLTHLPEYMIPAAFYRLDYLPLRASGKIDRSALSSLANAERLGEEEYVPPRTPIEERMTSMLAELLSLERVGVSDNFFLMGGNSLLGAQVIARVRDAFDVDLSLLTLFNHPTVSELSREVEQLLVDKLEMMPEDEARGLADQIPQPSSL